MSEQDRGAYAPQDDAPLNFDPRRMGARRGPAPVALLASTLVLVALLAGIVLLYRHGARHPGQPPQIVGAPVGETKSPPPSSEAPSDSSAGLQVYKTEVPPPGETPPAPAFAPAPETPQPRPVTRPPAPPPVTAAPLRAAEPAPTVPPAGPPAPAAKVAPPPKTAPAPPPKVVQTPKVLPPTPAATPASAAGGALVQVGALPSEALADKAWSDVARKLPGPMAGKTRKIETTTKDGKTFYRAYVGGFASHDDAVSFCSKLKAAGVFCIVR